MLWAYSDEGTPKPTALRLNTKEGSAAKAFVDDTAATSSSEIIEFRQAGIEALKFEKSAFTA